MKQFTFTDPATGFTATMTVTEVDGALHVVMDVDESDGITGDVRALYLNNADNVEIEGLQITLGETDGDAATSSDTGDVLLHQDLDNVRHVGSRDTNMNGQALKANGGPFDVGIEFGRQGIATDDVQHMEFVLSADGDLTIDSFDWSSLGLRVTSVGEVDGPRDGSLKLGGEEKPVVSTVIAETDIGTADLLQLADVGATFIVEAPGGGALDWVLNDSDPEGDDFELFLVTGAAGTSSDTFDGLGWSGWVQGDNGGQVRMNALTGEVELQNDGTLPNDSLLTTQISYTIRDDTGATDDAFVIIDLLSFD